ncbi:RNA polymerase sigma factor [Aquimarina brevivitae]|uniref:RNA polymerase sigma factor (Sigma-70 family) n=1 Tax=Aquimarina brevivitae TaxID=323412 RepID=A0A4Q7PF97_9FLAO|nr:sigma-70 family RNA polymerase sigma factor [Aquimarina brevivitae]RZS99153.1 RNA polymerase sigma factor (sigma-70 family) [Aquimarina brevivitae]
MQTQDHMINGILTGDERILDAFYQHNFAAVRRYVLLHRGTIEDAEDIFQEALLLLYQKLKRNELHIQTSIHGYFYGVSKNLWRNRLRQQKLVYCELSEIESSEAQLAVMQQLEDEAKVQLFQQYFEQLNSASQQIWKLFFAGCSTRAIAERLGASEGSVRKKKFDTKKKLVELMQHDPRYAELCA